MNANTIITGALLSAKVIAVNEVPPGDELDNLLARLNRMLDYWSIKRLHVFVRTEDTAVLTIGKGSYTIGTNGTPDISTVRPVKIEQAYLRDATGLDIPIDCTMTEGEYNAISTKTQTARPGRLFYKNTVPNGTISFDYLSDAAYEAHFFSVKPFTAFADLFTEYDFPPGYEAAMTASLALLYANDFDVQITEFMASEAAITLDAIRNANFEIQNLPTAHIPGCGPASYDIYTDS